MLRKTAILWLLACLPPVFGGFDPGYDPTVDRGLNVFPVGEEIIYDIYWGIFHVGTTHVTTEWVEEEGVPPRILIRYRTKTNKFIENFYPVDDTLESLIDARSFLPVYFMKNMSEGSYRAHEWTFFDRDNLTMRWESKLNGNKKTLDIEDTTRDIITTMYYFRALAMNIGDEINLRVMADEKLYDLEASVTERETIKLERYGAVKCLKIEPKAAFQGLFVRKGKVTFWVSDDDRRVCTFLKASVPVASIQLRLNRVMGPGEDVWIRKGK